MKKQTQLSFFTQPQEPLPSRKPNHPINLEKMRPRLKKYILLHILRAFEEKSGPNNNINKEGLINVLSRNMGNICKLQIKIFIETLIYKEYIHELPRHELRYTDKVYEDLKKTDKLIKKRLYHKKCLKKDDKKNFRG